MSEVCPALTEALNSLPRLRFPYDRSHIPLNGIYVLFEEGEPAHGGDRIVRVGTHTGTDRLPHRLEEHFLAQNKDRSIFRKNIGRALLKRDADPFLRQWELDLTPSANKKRYASLVDRDKLVEVEDRVTAYIQSAFSFVVLRVDDAPTRLDLEARLISTISWCEGCHPSRIWLGLHSPKDKIRNSGLWQENHLYKQPLSWSQMEALHSSWAK